MHQGEISRNNQMI
jgi:hypothetical protein